MRRLLLLPLLPIVLAWPGCVSNGRTSDGRLELGTRYLEHRERWTVLRPSEWERVRAIQLRCSKGFVSIRELRVYLKGSKEPQLLDVPTSMRPGGVVNAKLEQPGVLGRVDLMAGSSDGGCLDLFAVPVKRKASKQE